MAFGIKIHTKDYLANKRISIIYTYARMAVGIKKWTFLFYTQEKVIFTKGKIEHEHDLIMAWIWRQV